MSKINLNKNIGKFLFVAIIAGGIAFANYNERIKQTQNKPEITAEASFEDLRSEKQKELDKIQEDKKDLETKAEIIKKEKEILDLKEGLKDPQPAPVMETKKELVVAQEAQKDDKAELPKDEPKAIATPVSSIPARVFTLNDGKKITGQEILNIVKSNPNGLKLWQAFFDKFGVEVADTSAISLYYENGTLKSDSVGVCNLKYARNGDYRDCVFADINSAGMDAGLKQINTFYQRYRIAKLGGVSCEPSNSRDITDPCTAQQVEWLKNVDNNIKIALDIYEESGNFLAWYGYKRAFNV